MKVKLSTQALGLYLLTFKKKELPCKKHSSTKEQLSNSHTHQKKEKKKKQKLERNPMKRKV